MSCDEVPGLAWQGGEKAMPCRPPPREVLHLLSLPLNLLEVKVCIGVHLIEHIIHVLVQCVLIK